MQSSWRIVRRVSRVQADSRAVSQACVLIGGLTYGQLDIRTKRLTGSGADKEIDRWMVEETEGRKTLTGPVTNLLLFIMSMFWHIGNILF